MNGYEYTISTKGQKPLKHVKHIFKYAIFQNIVISFFIVQFERHAHATPNQTVKYYWLPILKDLNYAFKTNIANCLDRWFNGWQWDQAWGKRVKRLYDTQSDKKNFQLYRVFHVIGHQENGCCKHVFGLIGFQKASMSTQDWAQITFRSEIHPDLF